MSTQKIAEVWSELHPDLVADGRGQIKRVVNVQAVTASIDNILRTHPGERVMLPEFGSPLHVAVFESMTSDELNHLVDQLQTSIEAWDDRVQVTEMSLYQEPDLNTIYLQVSFRIKGHDKVFEYTTPVVGDVS